MTLFYAVSQQVNGLIFTALRRKEVVHIGAGTNVWNNVHIRDLTELYALVLEHALSGKNNGKSYENFFWGSVGEHAWGDVTQALAQKLHTKGLVDSNTPRSVSLDEEPDLYWTAGTSRTVSNRGFALGWKPVAPSLEVTLDEEIEITVPKN